MTKKQNNFGREPPWHAIRTICIALKRGTKGTKMKLIVEIRECTTNEVVFVTDWENFVKYGLTEPGFYAIVRERLVSE